MLNFIQCPICSAHEKIGADTGTALAQAIDAWLSVARPHAPVAEMENILNLILNTRERQPKKPKPHKPIDPLLL